MAALFCLGLVWQACAFAEDLAGEAQRAKEAMLAQHYPEAAVIYRRMAAELPAEPGVRFNLALALHSMGRYRESTQTLESIRAAAAANPRFWFLLGEGYLNLEEAQKAVEPLRKAAELDPSDLNTNLELASAWLESGQFTKSGERFQVLSSQHPELPKVWAGLSLSESGLGHVQLAKESMDRLAALPESAERDEMLARVYVRNGQRTEAIGELRAAEKLSPGNTRVESALARALVANREFDGAATILRALLVGNPDNSGWQFDLGDSLLETGQTEEAIQHLKRAVELSPTLLPAQAKLGEALLLTGAAAAAAAHLELAAPIDTDGSIHFQLATAYRRLGKPDMARRAMARHLELQNRPHTVP